MKMMDLLKKVVRKGKMFYALKIERPLCLNFFNPLATVYFNLRLLPFSKAWRLPIFVYGWPRVLSLYGKAEIMGGKTGQIKLNRKYHEAGAPNNMGSPEEFNIWGTIVFKGKCQIGTGGKVIVGVNGKLVFGNNCNIMSACNICAYESVSVGDNLLVAHAAQIFDTSFHFVADINTSRVKAIGTPVVIGNDCWICNSATIMGGTFLPDKTIVASHSLVNKNLSGIPARSLVAGIPAKLVKSGIVKIDDISVLQEIEKYF